jgi:hypothetical protein
VDKLFFFHSIKDLSRFQAAVQAVFVNCREIGQNPGLAVYRAVLHIRSCGYPNCFPQVQAGRFLKNLQAVWQESDAMGWRIDVCGFRFVGSRRREREKKFSGQLSKVYKLSMYTK